MSEIVEKIEGKKNNIKLSHYTPLQLATRDSYFIYKGESSRKIFRGKVWSYKKHVKKGMNELLLMQEEKIDGDPGDWVPFIYRSDDPNSSFIDACDYVPKHTIGQGSNRITKLGFAVSWGFAFILLTMLIFNIEIDVTWSFVLMIFGWAAAIASAFYYEKKRRDEDFVHTAEIYDDAPRVPLSRSFVHPITHEVMRFAGEVSPIEVQSSKNSPAKIRGYTVSEMSEKLGYSKAIRAFKRLIYEAELEHPANKNGELTEEEKEAMQEQYSELQEVIKSRRAEILEMHSDLLESGELDDMIKQCHEDLQDEKLRSKIKKELDYHNSEFISVHTELAQTAIERDKYAAESQSWMRKANSDVAKNDVVVAAKVAKIVRDGALVDMYSPDDLPNQQSKFDFSGANGIVVSVLTSFLPFILIFVVGMIIWTSIQEALANLGEWASFMYLLIIFVVSIAVAFFVFTYTKTRLSDVANNRSASQKMVMQ